MQAVAIALTTRSYFPPNKPTKGPEKASFSNKTAASVCADLYTPMVLFHSRLPRCSAPVHKPSLKIEHVWAIWPASLTINAFVDGPIRPFCPSQGGLPNAP